MAVNLGVHVNRQATAAPLVKQAAVAIPYVVGTAPVHIAAKPAKANVPVLVTNWDEAVEKFGYSEDWKKYTLCEFMDSHFRRFGAQPVIFYNALNPEKMKNPGKETAFTPDNEGVFTLPKGAILDTLKVARPDAVQSGQTVKLRPAGPAVGQENFNYQEAYAAAGVTLEDGGIYYAGGEIAPELIHDGHAFLGLTFPKPKGAKAVTLTVNGTVEPEVDLTKDGDFVVGGEYINYFAFAAEDGTPLSNGMWTLEFSWAVEGSEAVKTSCTIGRGQGIHCILGADYTAYYDESGAAYIQIDPDGSLAGQETIRCTVDTIDPGAVILADIAEGVSQVDACMTATGVVPDLICAPGWSKDPVVAAVMATKAGAINGLFCGKAVIDADSSSAGVTEHRQLPEYKNQNHLVDPNQILCWPMVEMEGRRYHLSTQLCGLMATVDAGNRGIPHESPSNKALKMDACVLEDGTEVNLTWAQVNLVAGSWGVVTAVNFLENGWVAKGNYTACYPDNLDVKDQFIPISRMFDFVGNTLIRTFWAKLDKPMNRRMIDTILDATNIWLSGLVSSEYLLGARCEILESENTEADLRDGILHLHVYITPPSPMQEVDFTLEYDASYVTAALL